MHMLLHEGVGFYSSYKSVFHVINW